MPFSAMMTKRILDWTCGGATPTRPSGRWLGLLDSNGNELTTISGYGRLSASFDASTNNSCSMLSSQTFGMTHSSDFVVYSLRFWDAQSGGAVLFDGSLPAPVSAQANGVGVVVQELGISLS
jgi:hypothetical protein